MFLFQVELKKKCYWNCWLGPYNRPNLQIKLHPTILQYPLINYIPCFEDRHHWHWLDPIINSKSHVNLALLSHLLQILTCFENQLRCHLGVIYEKLVKLSKIWNCQRSEIVKDLKLSKICLMKENRFSESVKQFLFHFHFSYQNQNAWVKNNPSNHTEHLYTHFLIWRIFRLHLWISNFFWSFYI